MAIKVQKPPHKKSPSLNILQIMLLQNAQIFPICSALKTQEQDGYSARWSLRERLLQRAAIETAFISWNHLLKRTKLIPFNDNYTLFNQKKKEYPIMNTLSREYALSRTGVVLFLSLLILSAVEKKCSLVAICAVITGIYFLSCRKHAGKIVELMQNGWLLWFNYWRLWKI